MGDPDAVRRSAARFSETSPQRRGRSPSTRCSSPSPKALTRVFGRTPLCPDGLFEGETAKARAGAAGDAIAADVITSAASAARTSGRVGGAGEELAAAAIASVTSAATRSATSEELPGPDRLLH